MSVSGNVARRGAYEPLLTGWGHIAAVFLLPLPFRKNFPTMRPRVRRRFEVHLFKHESVRPAFIFEPVVGATLGAECRRRLRARIAESAARTEFSSIADEVMTAWAAPENLLLRNTGNRTGHDSGRRDRSGYARSARFSFPPRLEAFERGWRLHARLTYQAHPVCTARATLFSTTSESHRSLIA